MRPLKLQHPSYDVLAERERLVHVIVEQVQRQGYYVAHVCPQPTQAIIDLRWAAQAAGSILGRHTCTYASAIGRRRPGMITVVVAPTESRTVQEIELRDHARAMIEGLIAAHTRLRAVRQPA